MGWLALDSLMEKEKFALNKLRFKAWTGMLDYKGHKILVMKPQTYMNLSGESVGEAARFYKVPADHVSTWVPMPFPASRWVWGCPITRITR